jgi:bifunctional UDP-N-acetylglucosamine pyrophosphorylase / glucosamine-1-phosphate N-acetyltransferase
MAGRQFAVVVLAAGKGTRLKSELAKALHRAGGRTLVEHVVRTAKQLGARRVVAVVGHQAEEVAAAVEPLGARTVLQRPQRGTGHALLAARRAVSGVGQVLVLPGDAPLVRAATLALMMRAHLDGRAAATVLTAVVANPYGYGRVLRRVDGSVSAIVEQSDLVGDQGAINEINSSIYCFALEKLWPALEKIRPLNAQRELYLTDAIGLLASQNETVLAQVATDADEVLGCNTRAELALVDRTLRRRVVEKWMAEGVSIQLPETVIIDPDVRLGADTTIEAGVQLLGRTRAGTHCLIGAGSILSDCVIGDGVRIQPYCVLEASRLASATQAGPFAHLRDGADLRKRARIGNFVEVKKSTIGEGVKAMHLSYLGDAKIGEDTNIGAGTITCNYDGVEKHPTRIGRRVFIGSDTALVAPVRVGDGAYVGAGSVVTENVPADALAIARGKQVNKPGWARKRRRLMAQPSTSAKRRRPRSRRAARRRRR